MRRRGGWGKAIRFILTSLCSLNYANHASLAVSEGIQKGVQAGEYE